MHYTVHVPGRTLKGNVCREGCCWRCPRVDVQGSCSGRHTSPATLQKEKPERTGKTYVYWRFSECSTLAREASSRTWLCDAPPNCTQLDGWVVSLQRGVPSRFWGEYWARGSLGWGMFAGQGKFSGEEFLFAVPAVWDSLRFGRGTWCACVGLTVGETPTWARTARVFGRKRDAFLSFGGGSVGMIPCTRLLPYVPVKSSSYLFMSVCFVNAHRCVFVCKWFVSDRVCYAGFVLLRCRAAVRALHFSWSEVFNCLTLARQL